MTETWNRQAYLFSILLATLSVRLLVGLIRPGLDLTQSVVVGVTTMVCLLPVLHRVCYGEELLDTTRKRTSHTAALVLTGALFIWTVALGA